MELKYDGKALLRRVLSLFAFLALFSATAATSGESGTRNENCAFHNEEKSLHSVYHRRLREKVNLPSRAKELLTSGPALHATRSLLAALESALGDVDPPRPSRTRLTECRRQGCALESLCSVRRLSPMQGDAARL